MPFYKFSIELSCLHFCFLNEVCDLDSLYQSELIFQVFKHYFEELEEEYLRDNFVVVVRGVLANKDKL